MQVPAHMEIYETEAPIKETVSDSEAVEDGVLRCREEILRLSAEKASVAIATPPLTDLHLAANVHVEALAKRGAPRIAVVNGQLSVRPSVIEAGGNIGSPTGKHEGTLAHLAWLFPEALRDRLHQEIDRQHEADVKRGVLVMSCAERDARIAAIDREVLLLEREEEFLVELGETFELHLPRRDDADPRAVLGIEVGRRRNQNAEKQRQKPRAVA
jgi:hypothetical protein